MARKPSTETATAIIGLEADIGKEHADTFRRDLHPVHSWN